MFEKTALLLALHAKNETVIRELVTSGADANQSLGPIGTVLHCFHDCSQIVQLLVELGADANATSDVGMTALSLVLFRYQFHDIRQVDVEARNILRTLLPVTRQLDSILQSETTGDVVPTINDDSVTLFLQHGAKISYCAMYLTARPALQLLRRKYAKQHSERFIELLRAADTDFTGVRQRIASVDKDEWETLNLAVLDQKLSQPLTLQTSCVISVRRQLLSVSTLELWSRIERLPLPKAIQDRLKLEKW